MSLVCWLQPENAHRGLYPNRDGTGSPEGREGRGGFLGDQEADSGEVLKDAR